MLLFVAINAVNADAALLDNGNGTINDTSALMWLQDADYFGTATWDNAISLADNFSFKGYDDWRLPSVNEMKNLFESGVTSDSPSPFINVNPYMYWSYEENSNLDAWRFNFKYGTVGTSAKDNTRYVLTVRDATVPIVPEPISSVLFLAGAGALALAKRRKK